jgi:benzoyl-CoA reductase/2-hydroxyglutaryl-CoA dehydratase subunit BcrC/BadD/HgdB
MRSAKQSFKIRHTQTAEGKIQIARETLGLTLGYFDVFEQQAQELFKQEITDKQFNDLVKTIYPKPEESASKLAKTKWDNKVILLNDLYFNSPTNANIKGNKWGAFNALTERLDYFRPTRKNNSESKWASASGFDPIITAEKNKILQVVKSF